MARLSSMPPGLLPGRHVQAVIAAAMLATASPAQAGQYGPMNSPPPSSAGGDRTLPQSTAPTAPAEVYRAAACVVGRDAAAATEMLATAPYSREEREKATSLLRSAQRCIRMRDPILTSSVMLRGAIAEALYETQFTSPPAARAPAVPVSPNRLDASAPETAARIASAMALADCTAGTQPETVRAMLATEAGSAEELAALRGMGSLFSGCLAQGSSMDADRGTLRALLADSLYRWSVVQRDGTASAWAAAAPPPAGN